MALKWDTDGRDRVARDVTGRVVIRIAPHRVGEPMRWTVSPVDAPQATGLAHNVTEAKRAAVAAYLKSST